MHLLANVAPVSKSFLSVLNYFAQLFNQVKTAKQQMLQRTLTMDIGHKTLPIFRHTMRYFFRNVT